MGDVKYEVDRLCIVHVESDTMKLLIVVFNANDVNVACTIIHQKDFHCLKALKCRINIRKYTNCVQICITTVIPLHRHCVNHIIYASHKVYHLIGVISRDVVLTRVVIKVVCRYSIC